MSNGIRLERAVWKVRFRDAAIVMGCELNDFILQRELYQHGLR